MKDRQFAHHYYFIAFLLFASAQSIQQRKNDSVFILVKKYFNAKQADSIYSLAGRKIQKRTNAETFQLCLLKTSCSRWADQNLIDQLCNDKISTYKLTFDIG